MGAEAHGSRRLRHHELMTGRSRKMKCSETIDRRRGCKKKCEIEEARVAGGGGGKEVGTDANAAGAQHGPCSLAIGSRNLRLCVGSRRDERGNI